MLPYYYNSVYDVFVSAKYMTNIIILNFLLLFLYKMPLSLVLELEIAKIFTHISKRFSFVMNQTTQI